MMASRIFALALALQFVFVFLWAWAVGVPALLALPSVVLWAVVALAVALDGLLGAHERRRERW